MRVVPSLTALILVVGCAACGSGGGPGDLGLGPTLPAVTTTSVARTTTTRRGNEPGATTQTARAKFARLAVYSRPDAPAPSRVLRNPWLVRGPKGVDVPQILLVAGSRPDGWIHVLLPDTPTAADGWVRAFDVRLTQVPYRVRIDRAAHRVNVLDRTRVIYRGRIAVRAARRVRPGHYYLRYVSSAPRSLMTANPYVYAFVPQLSARLPLGTPVDVA